MPLIHPLIHDWNADAPPAAAGGDAGRRDAAGWPAVAVGPDAGDRGEARSPASAWTSLGIDTANIGLPGAGPHVAADVERLARSIGDRRLKITANCAARTVVSDIQPIAEIVQRTGVPIECCAFIGSSPIRQYAEGWTLDFLQKTTEEAIGFAVKEGLTVMYVTEDTTRADPASLRALFTTALRAGASRLCIADTVGHATPTGARAVVRFVQRSGRRARVGRRHRLARPPRSRVRRRQCARRPRGRRDAPPRRRARHRRALRQHADRSAARQPGDDGLPRSRSVDAARLLRGGLARLRRADPAELPGRRPRRVPDRDRRARGRGREGVQKEGSRADGCRLRGRAREPRRPRAADRGRTDVRQVERRSSGSKAAGCRRPTRSSIASSPPRRRRTARSRPSRCRGSSTRRSRARHEGTPGTTKNSKNALTQTKC